MNIDGKIVAKELKALRIKNGYTIEDICENIGIKQTTAYKYEKDASDIKLKTLQRLLNFYKINENIFFDMICAYRNKGE